MLRGGVPILVALLFPTTSVSAGPPPDTCQRTGGFLRIMLGGGRTGYLAVTESQAFLWLLDGEEQDCDGATNDNISIVSVEGTDANQTFLVDNSGPGGPFRREINWGVDLGAGIDAFQFRGTPQADLIYFGTWQQGNTIVDVVDTDGDGQPNMDINQVESMTRLPSGGNDRVSGSFRGTNRGTEGTSMGPARLPLTLKGGPGKDKLTGGLEDDTLVGGSKNDTLKGGKGKDLLKGGGGDDRCAGGPGKDRERGCE
ncbi:MAG: hypothetical protein ACRDJP_15760 [Actinomycetota bacterium]